MDAGTDHTDLSGLVGFDSPQRERTGGRSVVSKAEEEHTPRKAQCRQRHWRRGSTTEIKMKICLILPHSGVARVGVVRPDGAPRARFGRLTCLCLAESMEQNRSTLMRIVHRPFHSWAVSASVQSLGGFENLTAHEGGTADLLAEYRPDLGGTLRDTVA